MLLGLGLGLAGCASKKAPVPAGSPCLRSVECAEGLACVTGVCTNDLSALADAASPIPMPEPPEGGMADGDLGDGAVPPADGGPPVDAGPGPVDARPRPMDAGPRPMDAGPRPMDAGPQPMDAGPQPMDAGGGDA